MLAHKIIIAAPGTGTVASLEREAGANNSIYINMLSYQEYSLQEEFVGLLTSAAITAGQGVPLTLIFDETHYVSFPLRDAVERWTLEHKKLPISCHWIIPVFGPGVVDEPLEQLLPLVTL